MKPFKFTWDSYNLLLKSNYINGDCGFEEWLEDMSHLACQNEQLRKKQAKYFMANQNWDRKFKLRLVNIDISKHF